MDELFVMDTEKTDIVSEKGVICVKCRITVPVFKSEEAFAGRANAFYGGIRERFAKFCASRLLKKAQKRPPEITAPYGAVMEPRVTFSDAGYVSVIIDTHVYDGVRRGNTVRISQVWNRSDGVLESADTFVPPRARCAVLDNIRAQARDKYESGAAFYKPDPDTRIINAFCAKNFYLVSQGVAFYFEAGAISHSAFPEVFIVKDINILQ
ncbi:MAG: hypothetical protein J5760_01370 [Clostridia bacterium]|nr:hypothetical protein [Clostridia bacterium]